MSVPEEGESPVGFAVLLHGRPDGSRHYDLIVDASEELPACSAAERACLTWSFSRPPGDSQVRCHRLFDHPRRFLTYEGPLRPGLGAVRRHDAGTGILRRRPDGTFLLTLQGDRIQGTFRVEPLGKPSGDSDERPYLWAPLPS